MSLIREQILAAALSALNTGRPSGVPMFVRAQGDSITEAQMPAGFVDWSSDPVDSPSVRETYGQPIMDRTLELHVEAAIAALPTQTEAVADAIIGWIFSKLNKNGFGLHCRTMETGTEARWEQTTKKIWACRITFAVRYRHKDTNAALLA
jgi:hypothetical protein